MIGTRLAHYEITSRLRWNGRGVSSQRLETGTRSRNKLSQAFTNDADRAARFDREARDAIVPPPNVLPEQIAADAVNGFTHQISFEKHALRTLDNLGHWVSRRGEPKEQTPYR